MSILSGWKKAKKYIKTADGYKKQSLDTSSETVYMNDGNTAEQSLGAIQGITDSLTATSSNVALSAAGGKSLQDQITTVNNNLSNKADKTELAKKQDTLTSEQTTITNWNCNSISLNIVYKYGKVCTVQVGGTISLTKNGGNYSMFSIPFKPKGISEVSAFGTLYINGTPNSWNKQLVQPNYNAQYGVVQIAQDSAIETGTYNFKYEVTFMTD